MSRFPSRNMGIYMATFRAIESTKPETERLLFDPYAVNFLSGFHRFLIKLCQIRFIRSFFINYIQYNWPGTYTAGIARTRLIDDMLMEAVVKEGINQIIILNARFDTRAHRLNIAKRVNFVEIDHPQLQRVKKAVMHPYTNEKAIPVDYLELDLNSERLADVMPSPLLPKHYKTLFIWEALTTNHELQEAEAIFEYLKDFPSGTQVIFTYVNKSVFEKPAENFGFLQINSLLKKVGEEWDFGLNPAELPLFMAQRNMKVRYDGGAADYRATYFGDASANMKGYEYFRLVRAEVK
ncbi:class I SAM-dependent methyltransferase [Chitinophaga silvatica]|uniref:S-adenosyl-L-methionine-dependent methyltransferase n=1 Tax=Chitinophaga silvatica TaxID=2282649 RepID=A0A3E1YE96_9BACT|nr:SAM-dependent methyltransferase [Chitinophaga silvatica]RFS24831.1 class I SAM-dependent methyltransferase [Chitinophaga silvatica]